MIAFLSFVLVFLNQVTGLGFGEVKTTGHCETEPYPRVFGDDSGDTKFNCVALNDNIPDDRIYLGGYTFASTLTNSVAGGAESTALIVILNPDVITEENKVYLSP